MQNCFILTTNHRSLNFFWPGKIDTASTNVFKNTSAVAVKTMERSEATFFNTNIQLLLYICLCFALTLFIVKRFLLKKKG
jgi:hypothetical protein